MCNLLNIYRVYGSKQNITMNLSKLSSVRYYWDKVEGSNLILNIH